MKKLTLLTAAALSCCACSPIFAQVQILRPGSPHVAPRLVSDQTALDTLAPTQSTGNNSLDSVAKEAIPNPFDYFAEDLPNVDSAASPASPSLLTREQSLLEDNSSASPSDFQQSGSQPHSADQAAAEVDATSIPVGRHHRRNSSVVDTIVDQATVGNIPHCATTPIYWGGSQHTPNPVAEWLLREQCVEGLWANYPQQRAAECAQMWAHLAGHSCGGCASGNCAPAVSGPCSVCAEPRKRHNRYTGLFSAAPQGCGTCSAAASAAPCASCGDSSGPAAPGCADCAQKTKSLAPGQTAKPGVENVAQLPSLQSFR